MFQPLIDDARDMIGRLHLSAEKGRDNVPSSVMMRYSEFQAWETAVQGVARLVFGEDSPALDRWQTLVQRRDTLVSEAMRKDVKRGEYFGMIDYFHLAIGVLREFEAMYQYTLATPPAAEPPTAPAATPYIVSQPLATVSTEAARAEPRARVARLPNNQWDVTITLEDAIYRWLSDIVAARNTTGVIEPAAVAHLAASIVERVATQSRRNT